MITEELIDKLVAATREAKETIHELHGVRKDALKVLAELDAKVDTIRSEVITANNELAVREFQRMMDNIDVDELAAGLKATFGKWVDLLGEATTTLTSLNAKDNQLADSLLRIEARVNRALI